MAAVELDDREQIARLLRQDPVLHAYELGDLDDFFWPHARFFGWEAAGGVRGVALLYTEPSPPVLIALDREPLGRLEPLLRALLPELPPVLSAHLSPELVRTVGRRYRVEGHGSHLKLGLTGALPLERIAAEPLAPGDLDEVKAFYAAAYPGTWFVPRMLETGRYLGLRECGALVCVAGVHVYSPAWRVAAVGNVATLPERRGRGLATRACGALCRLLLDDGIETIALNVRSDNAPALAAYRRIGFEVVAEYLEVRLAVTDTGAEAHP